MRSLESSNDDLPICLALTQGQSPDMKVMGHVRMTRIPSIPNAVWIESVIIHPDLRGKGIGKYLMLRAESFAQTLGFETAYLNTIDQQVFYSRIGYKFCDPVCAYGGNTKLLTGITSTRTDPFKISNNKKPLPPEKVQMPKWASSQQQNGSSLPPAAPPPPPPPPEKEERREEDAIKSKCAKLFNYQTLKDVSEPPSLTKPLRCLKEDVKAKAEAKKLDKDSICRMNLPKYYMKKILQ